MALKSRRKELKRKFFSPLGLITISILGISGILLMYYSGIFPVNSTETNTSKNGTMLIAGAFFSLTAIYCWVLYFLNIVVKPCEEVLYLTTDKSDEKYFINRKGRKINYDLDIDKFEEGYYRVLKTNDYIYQVLDKTNDRWPPAPKKSYWLGMYTAVGNFEGVLLLPVAYVILLFGLIGLLTPSGFGKIESLTFIIAATYMIVYDLIYKIKLKESDNGEIDETPFEKSSATMFPILQMLPFYVVSVVLMITIIIADDIIAQVIQLTILGFILWLIGSFSTVLFKDEDQKLANEFLNIYTIITLSYWFIILTTWIIQAITQGISVYATMTIPYWLCGLGVLFKRIWSNKKQKK